jgi:hypothetical protein
MSLPSGIDRDSEVEWIVTGTVTVPPLSRWAPWHDCAYHQGHHVGPHTGWCAIQVVNNNQSFGVAHKSTCHGQHLSQSQTRTDSDADLTGRLR